MENNNTMTPEQIQQLVSKLSEKELMTIVGEMVNQNRLCVPQFYDSNHSKYYGYDSIEDMNEKTDCLYESIDEMVEQIQDSLSFYELSVGDL